jgi:aspartyl-tRNA(Asn)/glutamyl-tRNA(Gln) amidotransferase subunit C
MLNSTVILKKYVINSLVGLISPSIYNNILYMDKKTVTTIAYLSRIALNEDNEDKITSDLENIIKFVDQLDSAEVDGIEPLTNPLEKKAHTREDIVTAKNRKDKFLERSPKSNEDYFLVPRVVE